MGFHVLADIWFDRCLCGFAEQWRTQRQQNKVRRQKKKSYVVGLSCLCWLLTAAKPLLMLVPFNVSTRKLFFCLLKEKCIFYKEVTELCLWTAGLQCSFGSFLSFPVTVRFKDRMRSKVKTDCCSLLQTLSCKRIERKRHTVNVECRLERLVFNGKWKSFNCELKADDKSDYWCTSEVINVYCVPALQHVEFLTPCLILQ